MGVITLNNKVVLNNSGNIYVEPFIIDIDSTYNLIYDSSSIITSWKDVNNPFRLELDNNPTIDELDNGVLFSLLDERIYIPDGGLGALNKTNTDDHVVCAYFEFKLDSLTDSAITRSLMEETISNSFNFFIGVNENGAVYIRRSIPVYIGNLDSSAVTNYASVLVKTWGNKVEFYYNGVLQQTTTDANQFIVSSGLKRLIIGNNLRHGDHAPLKGKIRKFKYYTELK